MARLIPESDDRPRPTRAESAGGLVIRFGPDGVEIVLGRRHRSREGTTWTLPKGTPAAGESMEETALREVREETGLDVEIVEPVGDIEYTFFQGGRRIHKTVHHWLMRPVGGDLGRHDHEFAEVRWVPLADAPHILTYPTERDIVERALPSIETLREREL